MSLPLSGRVAIVTGATRGIGRAIAIHLASLGASLSLIFSSSSAAAHLLAAELNSGDLNSGDPNSSTIHIRAIPIRADVSNPDDVKSIFETTEKTFNSPPHIVVHAAGILDPNYHPISALPVADFDSILSVNTRGAFLVLQQAAIRVVRGGGGRIIAISTSMVGMNRPGYGAYTASKAAVEAMVRVLAREMKGTGITANCVAPGPVATEMFFAGKTEEDVRRFAEMNPMGRIGLPEDVGPVVGFLCSDAGEWVNGQVVRVNGGIV